MKLAAFLGVGGAIFAHGAFLAFGGLLVPGAGAGAGGTMQEVELLTEVEAETPEPEQLEPEPEPEELRSEPEAPPEIVELARAPEASDDAPALDAASLSALEAALDGGGAAGGDFASALSFASGGRIGGTGAALEGGDLLGDAFSLAEIDQKPRAMFQVPPLYPAEMRGKKLEAVVTVIFVVDAAGKVEKPRAEKSTHPAFVEPALDAVKQWKFEPAVKGGQRVACKLRVPIRFQPS